MIKLTNIDYNSTLAVSFPSFEIQPLSNEIEKLRDELCIGDNWFQNDYPILFKFFNFVTAKAKYDKELSDYELEKQRNNYNES